MSQDHLHQADRDYSAANEPNEELLMQQLESAMLLADMFQGRRRVGPDGRGIRYITSDHTITYDELMPNTTPYSGSPPDVDLSPRGQTMLRPGTEEKPAHMLADEYDKRLAQTMAAFRNEPSDTGSVEIAILNGAIGVIREWVRRLRETGVGDTEVGTHACNSIDLGLVGLAKLAGKE